jgi:hypothetical protein
LHGLLRSRLNAEDLLETTPRKTRLEIRGF